MPMAALLLHQACEHLYQCVLWSLTLHGPRTHALDELREAAEAIAPELGSAWPRDTSFERRAFGCIRRAYVEVRYGASYRISDEELAWAMDCAASLHRQVDALRWDGLDEHTPQAEMEGCHG
jgi:HEPN domain-containing protein